MGVFGGSFDPIHIGHLIIAEILHYQLNLDQTLFLPVGDPPHKTARKLTDSEHRLAMLQRAVHTSPEFDVCRVEIDRTGTSYTVDTLELLHNSDLNNTHFVFLMGQDSLFDFPNWRAPERIIELASLGVAFREGYDTDLHDLERRVPGLSGRVDFVSVPLIGVSSRDIRHSIAETKPYRFQVLPTVAEYIVEHDLYKFRTDNQVENASNG